MSETGRTPILQRKARNGRDEQQARRMTPGRALRLALARAADELFDLDLAVAALEASECGQSGVIGAIGEERLIMVLDGPEGAIGAVAVDSQVIAGLIEMQTMRQVLPRPAEPRKPTQTDAALLAPLVDETLAGFAAGLGEDGAGDLAAGYGFGAMLDGPRLLGLLLNAPDFHLFRLRLDLGGGAKQGELVLALPIRPPPQPAVPEAARDMALGEGALMAAQAPMVAVLHRLRLPLADLVRLQPGERLCLPRAALSRTKLEDGRGGAIATCRLGQINGFRAVRLSRARAETGAVPPAFADASAGVGKVAQSAGAGKVAQGAGAALSQEGRGASHGREEGSGAVKEAAGASGQGASAPANASFETPGGLPLGVDPGDMPVLTGLAQAAVGE